MNTSEDGDSRDGTGEQRPGGTAVLERTASQNSAPVLSTPKRPQDMHFIEGSGSLTQRVTRSMAKAQFDFTINSTPGSTTRFEERLRNAFSKSTPHAHSSSLEESRTITYENADEDEEVADDDNGGEDIAEAVSWRSTAKSGLARVRSSRKRRGRSSARRYIGRKVSKVSTRDSTPSDAMTSTTGDGDRPRKRRRVDLAPRNLPTRRSARLSKPLTVFHKYPELPPEIKMMIWEAAIEPRVVYFRNIFTQPPIPYPTVQNKAPLWFMACKMSLKIALQNYENLFPLRDPTGKVTRQPINVAVDIVLLEPCCNGCRAKNCASRNFDANDRASIRSLAVQTDSPYLMPTVQPCWSSIMDSWPNVETLYLLHLALKGENPRARAMIRMQEGLREQRLRKRFDDWKKDVGKDKALKRLEFVTMAEVESNVQHLKDRYKYTYCRKTGLPEDIIIG
ncbi:hypothetical protein DL766_008405 [Monosporascus sp. MC13-8B]|uniref:2EXR domain-containing protein n=1 Tax=Monosporascus cannonballus TaxID=155416 RepID=A0ABY0GXD3_9PEZI|nr:hypothetical protein DL762_009455 [Monosporascus cannonballus]RYO84455.1 hypothetical protein DL763_007440 [Monosporascus cannonballus]RYP19582.1 hypothetical protein DL766_008405 [Monosporascus sp. MC13-8B]